MIEGKTYQVRNGNKFEFVKMTANKEFVFKPVNQPKFNVLSQYRADKQGDSSLVGHAIFVSSQGFSPVS